MKKLYRKSTVHPTPSVISEHLLSSLPAAILTLAAALSPADREVLAYLISCSSASFSNGNRRSKQKSAATATAVAAADHQECFSCNCFRCYMSYWVKWDSSPNRQLIHEIIDAFEESLSKESRREKSRRERRKGKTVKPTNIGPVKKLDEPSRPDTSPVKEDIIFGEPYATVEEDGSDGDLEDDVEEMDKGSVRRLVNFLGERIWSVWG